MALTKLGKDGEGAFSLGSSKSVPALASYPNPKPTAGSSFLTPKNHPATAKKPVPILIQKEEDEEEVRPKGLSWRNFEQKQRQDQQTRIVELKEQAARKAAGEEDDDWESPLAKRRNAKKKKKKAAPKKKVYTHLLEPGSFEMAAAMPSIFYSPEMLRDQKIEKYNKQKKEAHTVNKKNEDDQNGLRLPEIGKPASAMGGGGTGGAQDGGGIQLPDIAKDPYADDGEDDEDSPLDPEAVREAKRVERERKRKQEEDEWSDSSDEEGEEEEEEEEEELPTTLKELEVMGYRLQAGLQAVESELALALEQVSTTIPARGMLERWQWLQENVVRRRAGVARVWDAVTAMRDEIDRMQVEREKRKQERLLRQAEALALQVQDQAESGKKGRKGDEEAKENKNKASRFGRRGTIRRGTIVGVPGGSPGGADAPLLRKRRLLPLRSHKNYYKNEDKGKAKGVSHGRFADTVECDDREDGLHRYRHIRDYQLMLHMRVPLTGATQKSKRLDIQGSTSPVQGSGAATRSVRTKKGTTPAPTTTSCTDYYIYYAPEYGYLAHRIHAEVEMGKRQELLLLDPPVGLGGENGLGENGLGRTASMLTITVEPPGSLPSNPSNGTQKGQPPPLEPGLRVAVDLDGLSTEAVDDVFGLTEEEKEEKAKKEVSGYGMLASVQKGPPDHWGDGGRWHDAVILDVEANYKTGVQYTLLVMEEAEKEEERVAAKGADTLEEEEAEKEADQVQGQGQGQGQEQRQISRTTVEWAQMLSAASVAADKRFKQKEELVMQATRMAEEAEEHWD
jgi:hypothetical protein